jgi:hypothetical protein
MSKDLPYFRFTVQEWQNGNIAIESYETKGLFIDVCGFYWIRDCDVSKQMLGKRFSDAAAGLERLFEAGCIKETEDGKIIIEFLDEQFHKLASKSHKLKKAGRLGGIASAKARLKQKVKQKVKQMPIYKDKDKEKDNILVEIEKLKADLTPFQKKYPIPMLLDFHNYWTEPNKSRTKCRYQLEKTWDIKKRLARWASNDKSFKTGIPPAPAFESRGKLPQYKPEPVKEEIPDGDEIRKMREKRGLA